MKITRRTMLKAAAVGTAALCVGKLPAAEKPVAYEAFRGYVRRGGIYAVPILAVFQRPHIRVTMADLEAIVANFEPVPLGYVEDCGIDDERLIGEVTAVFIEGNRLLANFENLGPHYEEVCYRLGVRPTGGVIRNYRHCVSAEVWAEPMKLRRVVLLYPSDRPLWS